MTARQPVLPFTGDPATTCPWCGTEEPNEFLLRNNHWVRSAEEQTAGGYDWCATHRRCVAQDLVGNHIHYYARALAERSTVTDRRGRFDEPSCREQLDRCIARGHELGVDVAAILNGVTA